MAPACRLTSRPPRNGISSGIPRIPYCTPAIHRNDVSIERPLRPHTDVSASKKCCKTHECPQWRAALQHPEVNVNGSNGLEALIAQHRPNGRKIPHNRYLI
jgi:hypothetical protein